MTDLTVIAERVAAATAGPWYIQPMQDGPEGLTAITDGVVGVVGSALHPEDATFMAHAREDIPALLLIIQTVFDMHVTRRIQTGSETHGGPPGDVCIPCGSRWPCATVRAITL